ncbi:sulfatase family protein [Kriegella aquimaris]|uniref:Arylsulfatase A n=1 Tax=Kriegella aquimaris TaxID=192904 RepID=A0A1G9V480_9FLAO|nr:sulfatase [Kriegella aquimaris]SDM66920.1 Arylsulfatase A [Kriegella aquimaris]
MLNRHTSIRNSICHVALFTTFVVLLTSCKEIRATNIKVDKRPNILLLMSDNQSWNHLGCYGNKVLKTPAIDKVAKEGVLFTNAYCAAPSCSPARAAMLTGQHIWRLKEAANLWSSFPQVKVYSKLLEDSGYTVGTEGKGWGPGNATVNGWKHNPGGKRFDSFTEFYNGIENGNPWMYWFSSRNPHRPYDANSLNKRNIALGDIEVPLYLPDNENVRKDIIDYYHEIESFDKEVASFIKLMTETGQLENTIIIVCSDNGWQMPRGLANLYDFGTRVPLIISWPGRFMGNRKVNDFTSLNDLAPTFLELAGIDIPKEMTSKSLLDILSSKKSGRLEEDRNFVVTARERHAFVRQGGVGYPGRAIRTDDYLYIRNYRPEEWPAGEPPLYGDVDAHMLQYSSPTKIFMLSNKEDALVKPFFETAFGKRPSDELYDLAKDPNQLNNVAGELEYEGVENYLSKKLTDYLVATLDPRETEVGFDWDAVEYYKELDKHPKPSKEAIIVLGLEEEYNYVID